MTWSLVPMPSWRVAEGELAGVADEDHPPGDRDDVRGLLA